MSLEEDRRRAEQTKADTEYLARELAALRLAVGEVATRDYLRRELEEIHELLNRAAAAQRASDKRDGGGQTGAARERPLEKAGLNRANAIAATRVSSTRYGDLVHNVTDRPRTVECT